MTVCGHILDILSVVSGMFVPFLFLFDSTKGILIYRSSFMFYCTLFIYLWIKWIRCFENSLSLNWLAVLPEVRSICFVMRSVSSVHVSMSRVSKHEVSNNLLLNHVWASKPNWMNKTEKNAGNKEFIDIFLKPTKEKTKMKEGNRESNLMRCFLVCFNFVILFLCPFGVFTDPISIEILKRKKKHMKPPNEISGLLCWQRQIAKRQMDPLFNSNLNIIIISVFLMTLAGMRERMNTVQ